MKKVILGVSLLLTVFPVYAEKQFYSDVFIGNTQSDFSTQYVERGGDSEFQFSDNTSFGSSTGFGFGLGYQLNRYFALEARYIENGTSSIIHLDEFDEGIEEKIDTSSINLGAKFSLQLIEEININSRLGLASWGVDITITDLSPLSEPVKSGKSGEDIYWSIGANYVISNDLLLGLEYSELTMDYQTRSSFGGFTTTGDVELNINKYSLIAQFNF